MDLLVSSVVFAGSAALLCYWFRYCCLLILAARTARDYSSEFATANQLGFPEVRARLQEQDGADLDGLHNRLERDYAIIIYLLEHTSLCGGVDYFETAMLRVHYRAMSASFRLTRGFLRATATRTLEEMSQVMAHFANLMSEHRAAR